MEQAKKSLKDDREEELKMRGEREAKRKEKTVKGKEMANGAGKERAVER